MNYEIDNTKHVKIMVIESQDRSEETQTELAEYMFSLFDKGWKTLESMRMTANGNRTVLYWPEYKSNSVISGKFSIYAPYGMDSFSIYDCIKGVNTENRPFYFPLMTPTPNIFHI